MHMRCTCTVHAPLAAQALIKLVALGLCKYFKDPWNNLDFFIVVISYVSVVAGLPLGSGLGLALGLSSGLRA